MFMRTAYKGAVALTLTPLPFPVRKGTEKSSSTLSSSSYHTPFQQRETKKRGCGREKEVRFACTALVGRKEQHRKGLRGGLGWRKEKGVVKCAQDILSPKKKKKQVRGHLKGQRDALGKVFFFSSQE